jgi:Lipoprotein LpqB beta-propeller domain/Sporulation and spore germination
MKTRRGLAGLAVLAAAVALGGCVSLPSGGQAESGNGGAGAVHGFDPAPNSDQAQGGIVINPVPPGPQWQPKQVVTGFLAATGTDQSVARQYLTAPYARNWKPSRAATVIDTNPIVTYVIISQHVTGGRIAAQVTVTSQHEATLTPTGTGGVFRLQAATDPGPYQFRFELSEIAGKWRISGILGLGKSENRFLVISSADFLRDYQPRNLYFPVNPTTNSLVPYPVYIPDRPVNQGVTTLVKALTVPPPGSSWLYRAVSTGFPPGTKVTSVQVDGSEALVTLGGTAATADYQALQQMEAQLVTTLTNSPYSPDTSATGILEVHLQIKNSSITLHPNGFRSWVPSGATGDLFYQSANLSGRPQLFTVKAADVGGSQRDALDGRSSVLLPRGLGTGPLTAIAASGGVMPPTFAGCRGKEVYVVPLIGDAPLVQSLPGGNCTSLSWDDQGRLWVAAGSNVFVLTETLSSHSGLKITLVTIPATQISSTATFTSLKVAPDGVRIALIVQDKTGSMVYVTSTTVVPTRPTPVLYLGQSSIQAVGPDLVNPVDLTWWGPDHLLVLARHNGATQLYDVPLNSGQPSRVPAPPDVTSVTGDGSVVVVGTKTTQGGSTRETIESAGKLDGIWHKVADGTTPAYPG